MRASKIVFIVGLILLIIGIVIAITAPTVATWELKKKTLADGEALSVSAEWKSESNKLVEEVLTVSLPTYDYAWAPLLPPFGEAKDFVITGSAVEQSSPQRLFNFYIFDSVNFDLWREHKSYKAYYEDKGKTSVSFTFSIASKGDIPNSLCFLVEEVHTRPTVLVNATISWTEKSPKTRCSEYVSSSPTLFIEEAKDFKLRGNATEANGNRFNFYIMDSSNYWNWITDKAYVAIFEQKNINPVNFDVPLTKDQAGSTLYFVVENPLKDVNESVIVNAVLEWQEKPTVSATLGGWVLGSFIAVIGFIIIIIAGIASLVFKPKRPKGKTYTGVVQQRPPPPAYSRPSKPRPKVVQKDYVATDKIYCVYCGAENRADARFCRKCGKPMD